MAAAKSRTYDFCCSKRIEIWQGSWESHIAAENANEWSVQNLTSRGTLRFLRTLKENIKISYIYIEQQLN